MPRIIESTRFALMLFIIFYLLPSPIASEEAAGWLIAGPFKSEGSGGLSDGLDTDYLELFRMSAAGEEDVRPNTVSGGGEIPWKDAGSASSARGVDFIAAFGAVEDSVAYAYRSFRSSAAIQSVMRIGSDDGVKVWLNGELVFGNHVNRSLVEGQDAVIVSLREGENRLLVKVGQGWGEWGFSLAFVDPQIEREAAQAATPTALRVCLDRNTAIPGGRLTGTVMTDPAALIEGSALVELVDDSKKVLGSAVCAVSGRFSIPVPETAPQVCYIRAEGKQAASGLRAVMQPIAVGDPLHLARSAAATARVAAAVLFADTGRRPRSCPDPKATLDFLVSELEDRIPSGLRTRDSSIFAVRDVEAVAYGSSPLPGLRRYAYRSSFDDSVQPYTLYVPENYDPRRRYSLVLALHGARGNDWDMAAAIAGAAPDDMLILAPYGRGDMGWSMTGERDAIDVLDLVTDFYSIDPDRIYVTGRSMGGFGTWRLGALYASRFAAIAPFAGWTSTESLENLIHIPVLVVHGEDDDTVPIDPDRQAVQVLRKLGARVHFDALPGVGHDAMAAWMREEGPDRLLRWFRQWKRSSWPDEVRTRTNQARYGRRYWVGIEELAKPLSPAAVDARILDARHLSVETENVTSFSLDLRHPKLAASGRILILVDGINLTADAGSERAFFSMGADGRFRAARDRLLGSSTIPNRGGGLAALFDGPLCIVYGTAKLSRAEANKETAFALVGRGREGALSSAADMGFIPVLADTEVDEGLVASRSLILVGGVDENKVVARIARRLPVPVAAGPAKAAGRTFTGAGMMQVCPNPEAPARLVCVIAFPFEKDRLVSYAAGLFAAMRSFGDSRAGLCGFATPDLMIVERSKGLIWSASFDREWTRLIELFSQ